jgi:hypothetical protein
LKGRRETPSFYRFMKPKTSHGRRKKGQVFDEYARDFKKPKPVTLQDVLKDVDIDNKS